MTASNTPKTAVVAPMPSPSESTATAAKPQPGKGAQPPKAENASIAAVISQSVGEKAGPTKQAKSPSVETPKVEEAISESVSKETSLSEKPTNKTEIAAIEAAKPRAVAPAPAESALTVAPTSVSEKGAKDLNARVDQVTAQIKSNQNKMDDLTLQLQNVNKALVGLNNSIASLEKKLNLPVTVQPTIKKMKKKKVKRAIMSNQIPQEAKRQVEGEQPVQEKVILRNFVLKAIVPGRAWILLPGMGTVSIAEGEKIPGIGTVTKIDEDEGEVTVGSGEVITYGPDDH
jgi:intracellular multiplication protein IcmG